MVIPGDSLVPHSTVLASKSNIQELRRYPPKSVMKRSDSRSGTNLRLMNKLKALPSQGWQSLVKLKNTLHKRVMQRSKPRTNEKLKPRPS